MTILYATDHSSYLSNGKVYLSSRIYPILKRYADNFGDIILYSRFITVENPPDDAINASFICGYIMVNGLIKTLIKKDSSLIKAVRECSLVVGRIPAIPAYKAIDYARKEGKKYLTEAMGCAWDAYWNHGILGKIIAPYMFLKMRYLVKHADYASYVTAEFLQNRYPRKGESLAASNVLIEEVSADVLQKRKNRINAMQPNELALMTTAAVNVKYKGQQYVIQAIPELNRRGIRIKYYLVGDGDQSFLKEIAEKNDVLDQVVFIGRKPLNQVFELLDDIDIYLQPSLQEGLPRSVIEAMSRGCIVIGANTAGIPELLELEDVTTRKSVSEIVEAIYRINNNSTHRNIEKAERNFCFSKQFLNTNLEKKRNAYYSKIKVDIGQ